jgi:hypothetical protein
VVTGSDGVHRHSEGGAPPGVVRCHRRFSTKSAGVGLGHRLSTAVPRAVQHPIFPKGKGFTGLAWVVTATPRTVPPPPLSSRWNSTIGRGTAVSGALAETSSFAPTALLGLGAINKGGAWAWAGC